MNDNPELKTQLCKELGCNIVNVSKENNMGKVCVNPYFKTHKEYCDDAHSVNDCDQKIKCKWNSDIDKCTPSHYTTNNICKIINQEDYTDNKRCLSSSINKNKKYCYVDTERDFYNSIVPYTGIKNF